VNDAVHHVATLKVNYFTLTDGVVSTTDDTTVTITLIKTDLDALKALRAVANSEANTYLSLDATACKDMSTNPITVRSSFSPWILPCYC
jgi:hypothetical protein